MPMCDVGCQKMMSEEKVEIPMCFTLVVESSVKESDSCECACGG